MEVEVGVEKRQSAIDRYAARQPSRHAFVLEQVGTSIFERELSRSLSACAAARHVRPEAAGATTAQAKRVRREQAAPATTAPSRLFDATVASLRRLGTCCSLGCAGRLLQPDQLQHLSLFSARLEALEPAARKALQDILVAVAFTGASGEAHRPNSLHPFGRLCQRAFDAVAFQTHNISTASMRRARLPVDCALSPPSARVGVQSTRSSTVDGRWALAEALLNSLRSCVAEEMPLSLARCSKSQLSGVTTVYLLPPSLNSMAVYDLYIDLWQDLHLGRLSLDLAGGMAAAERAALADVVAAPPVSFRSFLERWHGDASLRTVRTRDTDKMVCDTCSRLTVEQQRLSDAISQQQDEVKRAELAAKRAETDSTLAVHLRVAIARRRRYQADVMFVRNLVSPSPAYVPLPRTESPPLSGNVVQVTFDYAASLPVPHRARPPGEWFYSFQYDLRWFGIRRDELGRMYHHLYRPDEGASGSNNVISLLHLHFMSTPPPPMSTLIIYADNCSGQNKTFAMMWYLAALVIAGEFDRIIMRFMLPGHTHNRVDGAFGIVRQYYARRDVDTARDVADMIGEIKNHIAGVVESAHMRNWSHAAAPLFRTASQLASDGAFLRVGHEFEFSSSRPGVVMTRSSRVGDNDVFLLRAPLTPESRQRLCLLIDHFHMDDVVAQLPLPKPISAECYALLRDKVLPHVASEAAREELLRRPAQTRPPSPATMQTDAPAHAEAETGVEELLDEDDGDELAQRFDSSAFVALLSSETELMARACLCPICDLECLRDIVTCTGVCERLFHASCVAPDGSSDAAAHEAPHTPPFVCAACENMKS